MSKFIKISEDDFDQILIGSQIKTICDASWNERFLFAFIVLLCGFRAFRDSMFQRHPDLLEAMRFVNNVPTAEQYPKPKPFSAERERVACLSNAIREADAKLAADDAGNVAPITGKRDRPAGH